jgi:hypothetical protein
MMEEVEELKQKLRVQLWGGGRRDLSAFWGRR